MVTVIVWPMQSGVSSLCLVLPCSRKAHPGLQATAKFLLLVKCFCTYIKTVMLHKQHMHGVPTWEQSLSNSVQSPASLCTCHSSTYPPTPSPPKPHSLTGMAAACIFTKNVQVTAVPLLQAGQGRAGQGRAGQGRAGQGRAGQGRQVLVYAGRGKD